MAARWLTAARCDWRAMTLLGAASKTQGRGIDVTATRDLRASGSTVSAGAAQLKAGHDATLSGTLAADGDLKLQAGGAVSSDGQLSGTGKLQLQAGGDATLKGSLRSNGDLTADGRQAGAAGQRQRNDGRVESDLGGRPVHRQGRHGPSGRRHRPAHARQRHHRRRDGVAASADHQRGGRCGYRRQAAGGRSAVHRCDRQDRGRRDAKLQARARCAWTPARR